MAGGMGTTDPRVLPTRQRSVGTGTFFGPRCFCAGTNIATPAGEILVEKLKVGDLVLTHDGEPRPIVWIGIDRALATRGRRSAATPVILQKGALADNVPCRDLRVTKGHSFYLNGVLIPAEYLINHRSIRWDDVAQTVLLFHVELDVHTVLLAEGAPAESYRDDGNSWLFQNADTRREQPPTSSFVPVVTSGPTVDMAWRQLLERSGSRPGMKLTDDADLHLLVNGVRVNAMSRHAAAWIFPLPDRPARIRIVSRSGVPAELGLARDDRVLGVALRRIALRQGTRFRTLEAADASLSEGFHEFEPANGLRWTDGDAVLPTALFEGFGDPMELVLHIGCTTCYPILDGTLTAAV
jgi:Hint domain